MRPRRRRVQSVKRRLVFLRVQVALWCRPVCFTALLLWGLVGRASAAVVLEVYIGGRPPEAGQVLQPLLDELEQHGMTAKPASVHARLGDHVTRSGITDPLLDIVTVINRVDGARRLLKRGACDVASKQFADVIARSRENLTMLVNNRSESQKALMDALEGLAVCQARLQKSSESGLTWEELVRSYPNQEEVIRRRYGTEPYLRYQDAQKRLTDQGTGTLIIEVDDRAALIFCNEWDHPQTAAFQSTVLPGHHRVLVLSPGTAGRWYDVAVAPGERIHLRLNGGLDAALTVSDLYTGFVFAGERDAAHLIEYARQLLGPDERVLIAVSFTELDGHRAPMGTIYRLDTGERVSAYAVPLTGMDDERRLRALARVLIDPATIEPDIVTMQGPVSSPPPRAPAPTTGQPSTLMPKLVVGAGVLAITVGAVVYARNPYDASMPADNDKRDPVVGVMLGGSVVLGGGVYMWLRESRSVSPVIAGMLGAGVASVAAGAELYLADEDPGFSSPRHIRNSAGPGLIIGGAGVALTGVGLWSLHREKARGLSAGAAPRRPRGVQTWWAPTTILVGSSHSLVSVGGSF